MKFDFVCRCNEECVADNGITFYADDLYYVDENFCGEFYYDVHDSDGKFLAWCSYSFLGEYFTVLPDVLEEVTMLFNTLMDDRVY